MAIIMKGLKGNKSISDICREHKISQGLYYQWRDRFLEGGKKALAAHGIKDDVYKTEIDCNATRLTRQIFVLSNGSHYTM